MTYILQAVSLVLALFGAFYKNTTKTDVNKENVYWHGLPVLTKTGKLFVILLAVSFTLSIYSSWKAAKTAKTENDDLHSKLNRVDVTSADILRTQVEEQKKNIDQFKNILTSQETTGKKTIDKINSSADLLRGMVDNSIDLLNQSSVELKRATNPINDNDILVSFTVYAPLEHAALAEYQRRLVKEIEEVLSSGLRGRDVYISRKTPDGKISELGIYGH